MKIYVTGVSGTGKSSIARALRERGFFAVDLDDDLSAWVHKDTGETAEWAPGMNAAWYEVHGWRCDVARLKEILSAHENIVVAGAVVNQKEFISLFDRIYFLHTTPDIIGSRIDARVDNDFGKHPIERARLLKWQEEYIEEMKDKGVVIIDAGRPLEEIVGRIAADIS